MGRNVTRRICLLNQEIRIHVYDTGNGLNVLIEGGEQGHIGAVAVGEGNGELHVIAFPAHKEEVVSRKWAQALCRVYPGPVVVEAGIHYDHITKSGIQEILDALDRELEAVIRWLRG